MKKTHFRKFYNIEKYLNWGKKIEDNAKAETVLKKKCQKSKDRLY